jgi:hypothetical protein
MLRSVGTDLRTALLPTVAVTPARDAWMKIGVNMHGDYGGEFSNSSGVYPSDGTAAPGNAVGYFRGDAHQFYRPGFGVASGYTGATWHDILLNLGVKRVRDGGKPWFDSAAFGVRQVLEMYDDSLLATGEPIKYVLGVGQVGTANQQGWLDIVTRVRDLYTRSFRAGAPGTGYSTSMSNAFRDRVAGIELANEVDIFSGQAQANWASLALSQAQAVKTQRDSFSEITQIPIVGPTMAFADRYVFFDSAMAPYLDIINGHSYQGGGKPSDNQGTVYGRVANQLGGFTRPYVATELGWHTARASNTPQPGIDEATQAIYVPAMCLEAIRQPGWWGIFFYELLDQSPSDDTSSSQSGEALFGLVAYDEDSLNRPTFRLKPAYTSLQRLINAIKDDGAGGQPIPATRRISVQHTSDVRTAHIAKTNGAQQVWLWRDASVWAQTAKSALSVANVPVTVTLPSTPLTMSTYSPVDSATATSITPALSVTLQVGAKPVCLEWSFVTTSNPAASGVAPAHPDVVQGGVGTPSVWVTWDRNDPTVTKYEVLRDGAVVQTIGPFVPFDPTNSAHKTWFPGTQPFSDTWNTCGWEDATVAAGTTYSYGVRAYAGSTVRGMSRSVSIAPRSLASFGATVTVAASGGDDTTAIQNAFTTIKTAGGGVLQLTGNPKWTTLNFDDSVPFVFRGQGKTTTVSTPQGTGGASTGTGSVTRINVTGSSVALPNISTAAAIGSTTLTFASAPSVSVGSAIVVRAPSIGGLANDAAAAGLTVSPGNEYDEISRWESNIVTAVSGSTVTLKYPTTQQLPAASTAVRLAEATTGQKRHGNVVIEDMTIDGLGPTDTVNAWFRHIVSANQVGMRVANVRFRYSNSNCIAAGPAHDMQIVNCDDPHHGAIEGDIVQYSLNLATIGNLRVIGCTFGTDGVNQVNSPITCQRTPRALVRHCQIYNYRTYAFNEHGGGSRDWIFENSLVKGRTTSVYGAVFCGNPDFANSGRGIIRNVRVEGGPRIAYLTEHSYGVRVLDCIAFNLASNTDSFGAAGVHWSGWDAPGDTSANYGAAKLTVKRCAVFGCTGHGVYAGRQQGGFFGDGTAGNPDPAGDGFGYNGAKDVVVSDSYFNVTGYAVRIDGTTTTSLRFQVFSNSAPTWADFTPALVTGDYWNANGDGLTFGTRSAQPWEAESFPWEAL